MLKRNNEKNSDTKINHVKQFKCHGCAINEIQRRIGIAKDNFKKMSKILRNKNKKKRKNFRLKRRKEYCTIM